MSKARDLANAGTALTTVSPTELGYLDGVTSAVQTQIDSKEATLPSQTGNSGKYLTTDGTDKSWETVSQYALPSQTGNAGKFLGTDGTNESWVSTVVDRSSSNWFEFFQNDEPRNTNNASNFNGITKDSSGNIYTVGSIRYTSSTRSMILIVKTNSLGEELLGITLALTSGNSYSNVEKIVVDTSGNIYVSGGFFDASNLSKGFVAKLTSAGAITWTQTFNVENGSQAEYATGLGVDSSGNVYVSGSYYSSKNIPFIVKLDSSGTLVWARRIIESNANGSSPTGMVLSSSYVYIYGQVYRGTTNGYDMFVAKYDLSGTLQWKNAYTGTGNTYEVAYSAAVDSSENLYVVGQGISSNPILMKLDSSGAITFSKRIITSIGGSFYGITLDSTNGHLYAVGSQQVLIGPSDNTQIFFIVKYDTSGNAIYERVIKNPSPSNVFIESIVSGSYLYICGYGQFEQGSSNAILARINTDGSSAQRFQVDKKKLSFESTSSTEATNVLTASSWTSGSEGALSMTYGTYSFNVDVSFASTSIGYF